MTALMVGTSNVARLWRRDYRPGLPKGSDVGQGEEWVPYSSRVVVGLPGCFEDFHGLPTAFACELGVPIMFRIGRGFGVLGRLGTRSNSNAKHLDHLLSSRRIWYVEAVLTVSVLITWKNGVV
jgi:hypothetical protein